MAVAVQAQRVARKHCWRLPLALYLWLHYTQSLRCSFKMLNHTYGSPDDTDEGAVGRIDNT